VCRRETKTGPRFVVRYRLGGRAYPLVHAGSFRTLKEAKARRDVIGGELAAGRNPLEAFRFPPQPVELEPLRKVAARFEASRVHLSENGRKNIASHLPRILATFGDRDPHGISFGEVQEWVAANTKTPENGGGLDPSSLSRYFATLRQVLDFADVKPNPTRDERVKLPRVVSEEPDPPTAAQAKAILERVGPRWLLPLVVLEQTAMRAGEAAKLVWGDVDVAESRFRLPRRSTKSSRPRWVQVPGWLMEHVASTCPPEDRTAERRVFPRFSVDGAEKAMASACRAAGLPRFSPHDFRHRRATRWHHEGVPTKALADRVGHADAAITLNLYSHVLDPGELPQESLEALLVWFPCGLDAAASGANGAAKR
jgi:integrase